MCEGGTVVDLVNGILLQNKKMKEEHIGYLLRELIKVRSVVIWFTLEKIINNWG